MAWAGVEQQGLEGGWRGAGGGLEGGWRGLMLQPARRKPAHQFHTSAQCAPASPLCQPMLLPLPQRARGKEREGGREGGRDEREHLLLSPRTDN